MRGPIANWLSCQTFPRQSGHTLLDRNTLEYSVTVIRRNNRISAITGFSRYHHLINQQFSTWFHHQELLRTHTSGAPPIS